jgi:S1/P1 Nuclease
MKRGSGSSSLRILSLSSMAIVSTSAAITPQAGLAWGPEGHKAVAILAARYMRRDTLARVRVLLGQENIEDVSLWADDIAHSTRTDTAPWHYIDIPLRDSNINLSRDCPRGQCVLVKTEEFLDTLGNPQSSPGARREALKFVIHFVADLHQPLHCEDNHDKGGNTQQVIFEGHGDNLHWVWDTGLVEEIDPDARDLAAMLARQITGRDRAAWDQGSISDWVLESQQLAQTVAYRNLSVIALPTLGPSYDQRAEAAIKRQLEKASVRLAWVLDERLSTAETSVLSGLEQSPK